MNQFLELNKHKLQFAFFATSITFLTIVIITLIISYFYGRFPETVLLISILLCAGIGFPFFILTLAYFEWRSKQKVRNRIFSKPPFDQLDRIGFSKSLINKKTRWFFTEETKEAVINNFTIKCNTTRENSKMIGFKALVKHKQIDKEEFKQLEGKFKDEGVVFDSEGLVKIYDLKKTTISSVQQLESDLIGFTELLKRENFESKNE